MGTAPSQPAPCPLSSAAWAQGRGENLQALPQDPRQDDGAAPDQSPCPASGTGAAAAQLLTGLPLGPSSPGGPLGPGGPAAPEGPASPFSPLSPLGPCREGRAMSPGRGAGPQGPGWHTVPPTPRLSGPGGGWGVGLRGWAAPQGATGFLGPRRLQLPLGEGPAWTRRWAAQTLRGPFSGVHGAGGGQLDAKETSAHQPPPGP